MEGRHPVLPRSTCWSGTSHFCSGGFWLSLSGRGEQRGTLPIAKKQKLPNPKLVIGEGSGVTESARRVQGPLAFASKTLICDQPVWLSG